MNQSSSPQRHREILRNLWELCASGVKSLLATHAGVIALLLLLCFFAQGMLHIRSASITFDEGPHLATGYTTLRTGDFRLQPVHIHPPLANVLAAAPLLLQDDLPDPRAIDGWEIASLSAVTDAVVWQYPHPARLALASRLPILWLAVLLGALIYRWAHDLGGTKAGMIALALYAFDPNMIAHGTLVTTDMAATLLMVATLYTANRKIGKSANQQISKSARRREGEKARKRELVRWMGVGVLLGLALLTKVSALMLVPVLGLIVASGEWRVASYQPQATSHKSQLQNLTYYALRITHYALAIALPAALVVWAGYGFEVGRIAGLPFPIPAATHVRIYQSLQEHYHLGHPTFLLGRVSSHGWWWYFPVAFTLKTPGIVLLLSLYTIAHTAYSVLRNVFTHQSHALRSTHYAYLSFPLLYAATTLFSTVNIGYRHLLPLLPFLYIGIANGEWRMANNKWQIANHVSRFTLHALRITHYVLLAWLILGTLTISPNYLTYFNEFAGGPAGGYRYLVDSNLDWGQNLWQLRDWMAEEGEGHVYYAHYSPARPQVYGINANFLPPDPRAVMFTPWQPAPGLYAIGATVLQGPYAPDVNTYAWFRGHEPTAQLGNALFVYRVEATAAATWAMLCTEAGLSAEMVRANLGDATLRTLHADCRSTTVYARGPGLLIKGSDDNTLKPLAFALRAADDADTARIYRVESSPAPTYPHTVATDGPADFLGYDIIHRTDTEIELRTYWRVKERPTRPLSLMAHLVTPDGTTLDVGDGMGFTIDQWQPGDVIIQRHRLHGDYHEGETFRIGGYWLDTLERWGIADSADDWVMLRGLPHAP